MAEIHVQTKKHNSSPAWIWVLVVLILAAVVAFFIIRNNKTNVEDATNKNPTSSTRILQNTSDAVYTIQLA